MNRRYPYTPFHRGTTLIEVLAGLVILGTLLVSVAIARGRFLRQWKAADQRLTAIAEADHLMEQWMSGSPQAVPVNTTGTTDDTDRHPWRTQTVPNLSADSLNAIVVRLQVFDRSDAELTRVDFLLHNPKNPAR